MQYLTFNQILPEANKLKTNRKMHTIHTHSQMIQILELGSKNFEIPYLVCSRKIAENRDNRSNDGK